MNPFSLTDTHKPFRSITAALWLALALILVVPFALPERLAAQVAFSDFGDSADDPEADLYEEGTEAIDDEEWLNAIRVFENVLAMKGKRADGALYWKAYAEAKAGRRTAAMQSLQALRKTFPRSRWVSEAGALELEIKNKAGAQVSPDRVADEELKLMAIQSLMHSDPERAMPLLEKILQGSYSMKMKERALFVLSQSPSPRAAQIIAATARGTRFPDLQEEAIQYLAIAGRRHGALLAEIYRSNASEEIKAKVLQAFMVSGQKQILADLAREEKNPRLRLGAVRQLGVMGSGPELRELYRSEKSKEVRKAIIESLFVGGGADLLMEIVASEQDPELRITSVRTLGLLGRDRSGALLTKIYASDKNGEVRKASLDGLMIQGNATALVSLARGEKDARWKREIVEKLSVMRSKEATDYLTSLLD